MVSNICQVLLPLPLPGVAAQGFDYAVPEGITVQMGQAVLVPFGRKELWGVVVGLAAATIPKEKIKPIKQVSDAPALSPTLLAFIHWVAEYTLAPVGNVLAMVLATKEALLPPPAQVVYRLNPSLNTAFTGSNSLQVAGAKFLLTPARRAVISALAEHTELSVDALHDYSRASTNIIREMVKSGVVERVETKAKTALPAAVKNTVLPFPVPAVQYSPAQKNAIETLQMQVQQGGYACTVLDGVTGSGKTEVYIEAIRTAMQSGGQALLLLPEIVLTSQVVQRFAARLGVAPTLWHSQLTPAQRKRHWRAVAEGSAPVVVGARSALFLPYPHLKLIVVDEEHEPSFKQEDGVCYHGRDMAVARAHHEQIPAVLCSATPSMESWWNIERGKYQHLALPQRHGAAQLPDIHLLDMRAQPMTAQEFISPPLRAALRDTVMAGQQAMLYLNRRGYAPLTLCRTCGYRFESPNSTAWMVLHQPLHGTPYLQCHHSGYTMKLPAACPECKKEGTFAVCGPGVERVAEEVRTLLPEARVLVMTTDTLTTAPQMDAALRQIHAGEVDIIIGTQMIAKGHHFPALTLVGVVDADLGLEGTDPRAAERTFQMLQQVSGRAGREADRGHVYIQTYLPQHPVMQALAKGNRDGFIQAEMQRRERGQMPPFSRLAGIILSGSDELAVKRYAQQLAAAAPAHTGVRVLGPAPAPLYQLRKQFRQRLLVVASRKVALQPYIKAWLERLPTPNTLRCKVDIDPYSFV